MLKLGLHLYIRRHFHIKIFGPGVIFQLLVVVVVVVVVDKASSQKSFFTQNSICIILYNMYKVLKAR